MNAFLIGCKERKIILKVEDGKLTFTAPDGVMTDSILSYLKRHKTAIIDALEKPFASLMELPDGRKFWLAPDGLEFERGGFPVIRRSVIEELKNSHADVKAEIMRLVEAMALLGDDLKITH